MTSKQNRTPAGNASRAPKSQSALLPALVAVGGSLAAAPSAALELGELNLSSRLGQPLRASIAYALGPNEQLADYCISLRPAGALDGMPALSQATIRVADGVILLTGTSAIREPLLTARVSIDCPYTPRLTREYTMFVDPPGLVTGQSEPRVAARPAAVPATQPQTAQAPTARVAAPVASVAPIDADSRYRVQPGDTLSQIAQRIEGRPVGLWSAVNAIFEANPGAFIDNDPNRLKAGSWLVMPSFADAAPDARFAAADPSAGAETAAAATADAAATGSAYEPAGFDTSGTSTDTSGADAATGTGADAAVDPGTAVADTAAPDALSGNVIDASEFTNSNDLMPGDVVLDDNPYAGAVVPATAAADSGAAATISGETSGAERNWLWWLVGGGVALVAGLLLFGRRLRDRFGSTPAGAEAPQHPLRRASDRDTQRIDTDETDMQVAIADDSPTDENPTLDADLFSGSGFKESDDVDVKETFAFAATTDLDFELPAGSSGEYPAPDTDIIAPPDRSAIESILESEVLPDDDEYDMSVIMDATRMPDPQDVTERDLQAVVIEEPGSDDKDDYTVSQEIDYEILERDYEDELTATQALNAEIEKAAAELAERLDEPDVKAREDRDEETTEMKLASVTALDVTANLAAGNDEIGDDEDTGVHEELTANLRAEDKTVEMPAGETDQTVEMAPDGDDTTEMEIESGTYKTTRSG